MSAGARVGDRYELGPLLGRGGMAEVREAHDLRLGRTVAVKRLRTDLATDPTFQARFRREAQAAAGLNHPNIVSVYDTGEELAPDGSHVQPFIVMEYVEGRTLREVLQEGRKVLPERALELTSGILSALDYSHRAGIVHRDIKPANVMLTPAGEVKVMDFGIARALEDGAATVTQTAAVVGTAQYLSPEQARGETVDSRSDVYSTGCVLYELLTGRPPFTGDSAFAVAYQHVREQPQPPSAYNPDLGPELDAIVLKALAKGVEDRYPSAADMQADLQRHLEGRPVEAATTVLAPTGPPDAGSTTLAGAGLAGGPFDPSADPSSTSLFGSPQDEPERRRRRWPAVLLGLLTLLLLGGGILAGLQLLGDDPAAEVTVPSVRRLTVTQAEEKLRSSGLVLGDVDRQGSDQPKGRVVQQDPTPQGRVAEGSEVDLVVSAGTKKVVIPSVIGDPRDSARAELEELDLDVELRERESSAERDSVVETVPEAGTSVEAGSSVTVYYSTGPIQVPSVVGLSEATAVRRLQEAGFQVRVEQDATTQAKTGSVLAQNPQAQDAAQRGSVVTITVSTYQPPSPTPTPTPTPSPTQTPTPTEVPSPTPPTQAPSRTPDETPSGNAAPSPSSSTSPDADDVEPSPSEATSTGPA